MKRTTFDHQNKLTLTVRTERGTVALDVGLEWLTRLERNYLFTLVKTTKEGGTVGFGVDPGEDGQSIVKLTLGPKQPSQDIQTAEPASGTPS